MKKVKKQAGFTLAELLIVVAIIAILVAIGIPAFSSAMERSRETVDLSNIRGAYAEFIVASMGDSDVVKGYYPLDCKQKKDGWTIDTAGFSDANIEGGMAVADSIIGVKNAYVVFELTKGHEKPSITFTKTAPSGTSVIKTGDGGGSTVWYLCKSGS